MIAASPYLVLSAVAGLLVVAVALYVLRTKEWKRERLAVYEPESSGRGSSVLRRLGRAIHPRRLIVNPLRRLFDLLSGRRRGRDDGRRSTGIGDRFRRGVYPFYRR